MSSVQVEILKPALITMPEGIDTIAIFMRDLHQSDAKYFKYYMGVNKELKIDSLVLYKDLSIRCVDALANYLESKGKFLKVMNYRDSVLFAKNGILINKSDLFKRLDVNACIFLDYFDLNDHLTNNSGNFYTNKIIEYFPEFEKSTKIERIKANLSWSVFLEGNVKYFYNKADTLYYGDSVYPELFGNVLNHRTLLQNSAEFLGRLFGSKIIPSWQKVSRSYYKSNNSNMLHARKYIQEGDWLKAASNYEKETKNKNRCIAAKAKYNMALVCEIEGKIDAAIEWLTLSDSTYKRGKKEHKYYCKQYIKSLSIRLNDLLLLEQQIRIKKNIENKKSIIDYPINSISSETLGSLYVRLVYCIGIIFSSSI